MTEEQFIRSIQEKCGNDCAISVLNFVVSELTDYKNGAIPYAVSCKKLWNLLQVLQTQNGAAND